LVSSESWYFGHRDLLCADKISGEDAQQLGHIFCAIADFDRPSLCAFLHEEIAALAPSAVLKMFIHSLHYVEEGLRAAQAWNCEGEVEGPQLQALAKKRTWREAGWEISKKWSGYCAVPDGYAGQRKPQKIVGFLPWNSCCASSRSAHFNEC